MSMRSPSRPFSTGIQSGASSAGSEENGNSRRPLFVPEPTMANRDARYIYEAVNAAAIVLKIVVDDVDLEIT